MMVLDALRNLSRTVDERENPRGLSLKFLLCVAFSIVFVTFDKRTKVKIFFTSRIISQFNPHVGGDSVH